MHRYSSEDIARFRHPSPGVLSLADSPPHRNDKKPSVSEFLNSKGSASGKPTSSSKVLTVSEVLKGRLGGPVQQAACVRREDGIVKQDEHLS